MRLPTRLNSYDLLRCKKHAQIPTNSTCNFRTTHHLSFEPHSGPQVRMTRYEPIIVRSVRGSAPRLLIFCFFRHLVFLLFFGFRFKSFARAHSVTSLTKCPCHATWCSAPTALDCVESPPQNKHFFSTTTHTSVGALSAMLHCALALQHCTFKPLTVCTFEGYLVPLVLAEQTDPCLKFARQCTCALVPL